MRERALKSKEDVGKIEVVVSLYPVAKSRF